MPRLSAQIKWCDVWWLNIIIHHITTETCHKQTEPEDLLIKKLDRTSVYAYIILSTAREVIWCVKFDTSCHTRILFGKKITRNHPKQTSANITLPNRETPCPTPQCPNAWSLEKHSIVPVHLFSEVIGRVAQLFRSITNLISKCSRSHHHTWQHCRNCHCCCCSLLPICPIGLLLVMFKGFQSKCLWSSFIFRLRNYCKLYFQRSSKINKASQRISKTKYVDKQSETRT